MFSFSDVKNARSGKDGMMGMGSGNTNPEPGSFRDRSPIRRREFDLGSRGREPEMPMRGREPEMLMRGREQDRRPRDFDGRDRDWNREHDMEPYPMEPFMDHERDLRARDPFLQIPPENSRGNFG